jgi:hypothetical protein
MSLLFLQTVVSQPDAIFANILLIAIFALRYVMGLYFFVQGSWQKSFT